MRMKRLAILHVTREFPDAVAGGIEQSIAIAATAQPEVDHVVLCLGQQTVHRRIGPVRVWRVKHLGSVKYCPLSVAWFQVFAKLASKADLVHVHSPFPLGELTSLFASVPVICTYHADVDHWLSPLYRPLQSWWLGRIHTVISTSEHYRQSSPVLRKMPHRTRAIPFGLPVEEEAMIAPEAELPRKFFLFLGSLRWYKGIEILIAAANRSGLPVVIAGDGDQRMLVQDSRFPGVWLGRVSDAQRAWLLRQAVGLILPSTSRAEAFGLVLLESMRAGKPAICTRLGTATDWLVAEGETGIVVNPGDIDALVQAMLQLWRSDTLASEMGRCALDRFQTYFRDTCYAEALQTAYQDALA